MSLRNGGDFLKKKKHKQTLFAILHILSYFIYFLSDSKEPSTRSRWQGWREYFSFFNTSYICFVMCTSIAGVGYYVPFNMLFDFMILEGQTKEISSLALSLAGVGSIVSRILVGFVGDYKCCHRIYYYLLAVFMCGATTIACVHLTYSWQFLVYGILYGMGSGKFISISLVKREY